MVTREELKVNKIKTGIMITAVIFLFVSLGYCQELSDWERKMYYESAWQALQADYQSFLDSSEEGVQKAEERVRQFLSQNGLTQAQLEDIVDRGNKMPFTAAEEQISQELKTRITDDLTPDEIMDTLDDLANKYGMSMGQVSSVFTRRIAREGEEE